MGKIAEAFRKRFGDRLAARGAKAEFVQKSGIPRSTFDRWLVGPTSPDLDQLEEIAAAFEMSPIDLVFPGELPKPVVTPPSRDQVIDEAIRILEDARSGPKTPSGAIPEDILELLAKIPAKDYDFVRTFLQSGVDNDGSVEHPNKLPKRPKKA